MYNNQMCIMLCPFKNEKTVRKCYEYNMVRGARFFLKKWKS